MGIFSWLFGKKKKGFNADKYSIDDYESEILNDSSSSSKKRSNESSEAFHIPMPIFATDDTTAPTAKSDSEDDDILIPLSEMNKKGTGKARKKTEPSTKEKKSDKNIEIKSDENNEEDSMNRKERRKEPVKRAAVIEHDKRSNIVNPTKEPNIKNNVVEPKKKDNIINPKNKVSKALKDSKAKGSLINADKKGAEEKNFASNSANKPTKKLEKSSVSDEPIDTKEIEDNSPEVMDAVAVQESKATANGKFDIRRAKDGRYFFSLYASNHAVIAYSQIYSSTKSVSTGINSVITNAPKAPIEDTTLKNPTSLPCPKWELYIDKAGQYRFRLYASNGLCVCHASHGYMSKGGAKGGIESIKRFSVEAKVDKSYLNK